MTDPWRTFPFFTIDPARTRPRVAISACLVGQPVRYDGTDKLLETTSTVLSKHLMLEPICPEVGAGMAVPRPPIELQRQGQEMIARGRDDPALNPTRALRDYAAHCLEQLGRDLQGYILQSRSPSCGLGSTPVHNTPAHNSHGTAIELGNGIQAGLFREQLPWLVMAEDTELVSAGQCTGFVMKCLVLADIEQALAQGRESALQRHYAELLKMPQSRPLYGRALCLAVMQALPGINLEEWQALLA